MGLQETDLLIRERPALPRIQQDVFDFSVVDDHLFKYQIDIPTETAKKKGFLVVSASKIESALSKQPPEEELSKDQLMERSLRIAFGVLAHDFASLSAAATICRGIYARNQPKQEWEPENLAFVFRTWSAKKLAEAAKILNRLPAKALINEYDYQKLWQLLEKRAFEEKPFTDTFPLPLIFPASGDRLPTPEEILAEWRSQGLSEIGLKFAQACNKLQKLPTGTEFLSYNQRGNLQEASVVATISTTNPPVKLVIPLRLDELWYHPKAVGNGRLWEPWIIDLKTSIPLKTPAQPITERPQIAPFLYLLAAGQIPFGTWKTGETKRVFLGNSSFNPALVKESAAKRIEKGYLPPIFILRKFNGEEGTITDSELKFPPDWREKLLQQLFEAQEKLKK